MLRGKLLTREQQPLAGVTVSVKDHPEYGQTQSRADGEYDLAVNGGGVLTLNYQKPGYLPAQRQASTPWQDYLVLDDIVLVALDPIVSTITLNADSAQTAQGSVMSDADGERRATLVFPTGTHATMTLPDGQEQALTQLHIRATEYTLGANGPKAMPGPLPPTSGYTYAVELSADEAIAAGAKSVNFSQAVPFYVDNFLNFPVGEIVPVGWYDRDKAAWIPSDNGKVIKIVAIVNGKAQIDSNGDNLADTALNLSEEEQVHMAALYPVGKTLWRTLIKHMTPWDCNWPKGFENGKSPPDKGNKGPLPSCPDQSTDTTQKGCLISSLNRELGEQLSITGTPYTLHYQSKRAQGYKPDNLLSIPITDATIPSTLQSIDLTITIAGRQITKSFTIEPNQTFEFIWDGLDAYGRAVKGSAKATVAVSYRYKLVYYRAREQVEQSFAQMLSDPNVTIIGCRETSTGGVTRTWEQVIDGDKLAEQPVDGWSLSHHHRYNPVSQSIELGNGQDRNANKQGPIVTTVAGNGNGNVDFGDGGLATAAGVRYPHNITVAPDGSLYISNQWCVRRVNTLGIINTVAGNCKSLGYSGDGGPATSAKLSTPKGIAVNNDGSFYIADYNNNRIRFVDTSGNISTVVGTGVAGYSGDGGLAINAQLSKPTDVALGQDGTLYIVDYNNERVRKVTSNGIITTIAGNGLRGYPIDGKPAIGEKLFLPNSMAISPYGVIYFTTDSHHIRRIDTNGLINNAAGGVLGGFSGDGGSALQAAFNSIEGIALGQDGSLYLADDSNERIRKIGANGVINTIAGSGVLGFDGDGGPALKAKFYLPKDVALSPDGALYIADTYNSRIRRLSPSTLSNNTEGFTVTSYDGHELYHFNSNGQHLRTLNALTGAVKYRFGYDSSARLTSITDAYNAVTTLERNAQGQATAIVAPDGQRTTLSLDSHGYLSSVTNPAGEQYQMSYSADGLLTTFTDPNQHQSHYSYDAQGRLSQDLNAIGGGWLLASTEHSTGFTTTMTSGEGRSSSYRVDYLSTGERKHTNTAADGTIQTHLFKPSSYQDTVTEADGTVRQTDKKPDARFGMQAPVENETITLPSGLSLNLSQQRQAQLSNVNDLLSLTTLTETSTLNNQTTTRLYDAASKIYTTTTPTGRTSRTTVDEHGKPVKHRLPGLADIDLSFDTRGRLASLIQGSGSEQRLNSYAYYESGAAQGYLHTVTDALNRTVSYDYNLAGRVTRQTLPDGRAISYDYDAKGNLTALTPPGRSAHVFDYTAGDQTETQTPPAIDTSDPATRYRYNKDKQLTQITRPDGANVTLSYDDGGRLSTLTAPHGDTGYSYDSAGRLQTITTPDGQVVTYSYDGSLLTSQTLSGAVTGSLHAAYDNFFRVKSLKINAEEAINLSYDRDGLLSQAGSLTLTHATDNGLLTGTTLDTINDHYQYNSFGEVSGYQAQHNTDTLAQYRYQRDPLGRITQQQQTLQGVTTTYDYTYDDAGRLSQVKRDGVIETRYGYDDNGNRISVNGLTLANYDEQDRLLSYNGNAYSYTVNGDLASKTVANQTTHYQYDIFGNLRQVTLPNGKRIDYLIDGQSRRIGKQIDGMLVQGFLYQNQISPIAELDGNNQIVARFVYADKGNVPAYLIKNGQTYRVISDHLGSPRLIVNTQDGSIAQRMDYDAFGNVTYDSNPGFQPFGFAGGLYDRDTGLVRFGARDYDAETGRWTAKDPIGFGGGDTNLYGYVLNDAINFIDPLGLCDCKNILNDALAQNNDPGYGFNGGHGALLGFGPGSNKCNLFVFNVLNGTGVRPARWSGLGGPIAAGQGGWGDDSVYIPYFPVTYDPKPGDVVAIAHDYGFASGHVAIVVDPGHTSIGAGANESHITGWPWDPSTSPQGKPVYRHCSCKQIGQ